MIDKNAQKQWLKDFNQEIEESLLLMISESAVERPVSERIFSRIDKSINSLSPQGGKTVRQSEGRWHDLENGIQVKILHTNLDEKIQISLMRIAPGTEIPAHDHVSDEECLVLEGDLGIDGYTLYQGDFHLMTANSRHAKIFTKNGCLLYLRHDLDEIEALKLAHQ